MSEMPEPGAREVQPYRSTVNKEEIFGKDFSVKPQRIEEASVSEVETSPKEESARESALSLKSTPTAEQTESGTPAQTPASKENGKDNEQSEDQDQTASPDPESSSPDSSSQTSPGNPAPPAPTLPPPTSVQTQKP